jgi:hypothetical protein
LRLKQAFWRTQSPQAPRFHRCFERMRVARLFWGAWWAFRSQVGLLSCSCKPRVGRTQLRGMPGRLEAS